MVAFVTNGLLGATLNSASTYSTTDLEKPGPGMKIGTMAWGTDGSAWVFVKLQAAATCTAGDVLVITDADDWIVQAVTNTLSTGILGQIMGVAGATGTAGQYLWMQVYGYVASINVATSSTAYTALHTGATAGRVTTTSVGGTSFGASGAVILATAAANVAAARLNWPTVGAAD